jgi:hypothetical protein
VWCLGAPPRRRRTYASPSGADEGIHGPSRGVRKGNPRRQEKNKNAHRHAIRPNTLWGKIQSVTCREEDNLIPSKTSTTPPHVRRPVGEEPGGDAQVLRAVRARVRDVLLHGQVRHRSGREGCQNFSPRPFHHVIFARRQNTVHSTTASALHVTNLTHPGVIGLALLTTLLLCVKTRSIDDSQHGPCNVTN